MIYLAQSATTTLPPTTESSAESAMFFALTFLFVVAIPVLFAGIVTWIIGAVGNKATASRVGKIVTLGSIGIFVLSMIVSFFVSFFA